VHTHKMTTSPHPGCKFTRGTGLASLFMRRRPGLGSNRRPAPTVGAAVGRVVLLGLVAACLAAGQGAPRAAPRLAQVRSWAFAIGAGDLMGDLAARYAPFDLVVVDAQEATRAQVTQLHERPRIVLGYLDVGTIEPGRPWFAQARRYRLDYWPDWGEWYADVAAAGYRRLLLRTVAPALLEKGFDGLFLDNVDMIASHPRQRSGMRLLVASIAQLVHSSHRLLFAQNGENVIGPILNQLDGWNREDVTSSYDFARHRYLPQPTATVHQTLKTLRSLHARGLFVTTTDYVAANNSPAAAQAIRNACSTGALPYLADIQLQRIPHTAPHCPGR